MAGVAMVPSLRVPALQSAACGGQIAKPLPPPAGPWVGLLRVSKYRSTEARRGRCKAVPTSIRCRPAVTAIAEPNSGKGYFTTATEQQNATAAAVGLLKEATTSPAATAAASDLLYCGDAAETGRRSLSTVGKSTNIRWHECPVGKLERQKLLGQKGCVVWITGLSGSGKSTMACALSRELHGRGHLSYLLDGDNVRHGLNKNLSFNPQDREENIRRVGEVAKLFADSGVICIASLISPYKRDRDACRALLPNRMFIEVFMDMPLKVCEARDPKGLYKLARAGKIKGFTGIDDPYEPPLNCEIVIQQRNGVCPSPEIMAEQVMAYLELNGFLHA